MKLFRRRSRSPHEASPEPAEPAVAEPDEAPSEPPPTPEPPPPEEGEIRVSRTLVKSEPELAELVAAEPRLAGEGVAVSLGEKGFGTRVAISAKSRAGLSERDLQSLLDGLAEPQKRPFTNS
jgi:hypothetical protein